MHATREKYTAREMDLRRDVLSRPRRNVSENASEIWEWEWGWNEGAAGAYLVRYVGCVNVIISQILKGELSHARVEQEGPRRIDHRSDFLKYE